MAFKLSARIGFFWAVVLAALGTAGLAQTASPAQRLLDGMVKALGGKAFLEATEVRTSGRLFTFRRDEVAASDVYLDYVRYPDMRRTELGKEKQKTVQINKGEQGWTLKGKDLKEVEEQVGSQIEEFLTNMKTSFGYVTRFVLKAPKTTLLHTGGEIVDFRKTDVVEVRDADKNLFRYFIDRETHLPVRFQVRRANSAMVFEESYANWHKFDGVMTPLFVTRYRDGIKLMEVRADNAAYNPGLPETLFVPPAGK